MVVVIMIYWIPNCLEQGVYKAITQYNKMKGQQTMVTTYQKQVFQEILEYCRQIEDLNDIILAEDMNQDIAAREIQHSTSWE